MLPESGCREWLHHLRNLFSRMRRLIYGALYPVGRMPFFRILAMTISSIDMSHVTLPSGIT
jgi:hypothetical protein